MGPGLRNPTAEELKSKQLFRGASYLVGDELETLAAPKLREEVRIAGRRRALGGARRHLLPLDDRAQGAGHRRGAAAVPDDAGRRRRDRRPQPRPPPDRITDDLEDLPQEARLVLAPQARDLEADAYWGAKDTRRCDSLPYELDADHPLGHFRPPRPSDAASCCSGSTSMVVANFGWAIVILTVLIKLVLLPLTHKSYVSMQKMQKLTPKIEAIKAEAPGQAARRQGPAQSRGPAQDERGDAGAVQGRGREPGRRLPAAAAADAGVLRLLRAAAQLGRALERALDPVDPRSLGERSLLRAADRHAASPSSCSSG